MSYRGRSLPSGVPISIDNISSLQGGSFLTPSITNAGNTSIYALSGQGGGGSAISTFSTLVTSTITGFSASFSTIQAYSTITAKKGIFDTITSLSSITVEATDGNLNVIGGINLDGNILTTDNAPGGGGELLLNGIPLATTSNISSITDWALYPAVSTINCSANNILNVGNIVGKTGDMNLSNVGAITFDIAGTRALVNLSTINGAPYVPGSSGPSNQISGTTTFDIADAGASPSISLAEITAQNGSYGKVAVTANAGFGGLSGGNISLTANGGSGSAGLYGQIDIVANQGTASGITTGGKINITANSGFSGGLTSAVNVNAGGITVQSGITSPVASVAGYTFLGGNSGVNICGGLPGTIPNVPGTTYIYGTTGVEVGSDMYMTNVYPYQYGIFNAADIVISGRTLDVGLGPHTAYVNLSTCKTIGFGGQYDTTSIGQITGLSTINGVAWTGPPGLPTQIAQGGASVSCGSDGSISGNTAVNKDMTFLASGNVTLASITKDVSIGSQTGDVLIQSVLSSNPSKLFLNRTGAVDINGGLSEIYMSELGDIYFNNNLTLNPTGEILTFPQITGSNVGQIEGISTINGIVFPPPDGIGTQIAQGGASVQCTSVGGIQMTTPAFHSITFNNNLNIDATGKIITFPQVAGSNVGAILGLSTINSVAYPLPSFVESYQIYVAPNGNDTTGTGSQQNPYLTIGQAIIRRAVISFAVECSIVLSSGTYIENFTLGANTFLVGLPTGEQDQPCNVVGLITLNGSAGQVGLSGLQITAVAPTTDGVLISGSGSVYSIYNCNITGGTSNAIQIDQGTTYITECRIISNNLTGAVNPAISIGSGAIVTIRNTTISNQASNPSAVMTCNGTLTMRGCVLQSANASTSPQALIVFSGSGGKTIEISNCNLSYSSVVVDVVGNKCCVQFQNATGTYTVTMTNCVLLCEGAITGVGPQIQCVQKPGAGVVTMSYGNLLSGANANHIAPTITHVALVPVT